MHTNITLLNGVERNQEHPHSFHIPTQADIESIKLDNYVKIGFCEDEEVERMWVQVTEIHTDSFTGTVANDPILVNLLFGDKVTFERKHILDILKYD